MPVYRVRLAIDATLVVIACLACYTMGKDLNVDMLSYHLYSAHAFWSGTYTQTYMGAGSQSYINPVGYLPFYWMITDGWNSYVIAAIFSATAAIGCMFLWRIAFRWLFEGQPNALALSILAAILGGASPLFLATLGTSFLDPIQAALFIASVYLFAEGIHRNDLRWVAGAGMVLGIATGLKLSMAHLAVATTIAIMAAPAKPPTRIFRLACAAAGLLAGMLLSGGYWAWYLFREYGNPVFPFVNSVFASPDFPAVSLGLDRFSATSWIDVFTLPFRMAALKSGVYAEIAVPDVRFALAVLVVVALLLATIMGKNKKLASGHIDAGVPAYLAAVMLLGYATMVLTSGNGRYFLPLFLMIGPILVWLLARLLVSPRLVLVSCVVILLIQVFHGGSANYRRWDSTQWTERWIDVDVPAELASSPHRYLFSGSESDTFIAAFLNRHSKYLMIQGKNPLSPNREGSNRVRNFLNESGPELRILVRESETQDSPLYKTSTADPVTLGLINDDLAPWNLKVSNKNCLYIGVVLGRGTSDAKSAHASSAWPRNYSLLSCPVMPGSTAPKEFHALQAKLENMSDVLAKTCPALFPAPPSFPIKIGDIWLVRFAGSDVVLSTDGSEVKLTRSPFGPFNMSIGKVDPLLSGQLDIPCSRLPRR